jgi:hypothetical protein
VAHTGPASTVKRPWARGRKVLAPARPRVVDLCNVFMALLLALNQTFVESTEQIQQNRRLALMRFTHE